MGGRGSGDSRGESSFAGQRKGWSDGLVWEVKGSSKATQ